MVERRNLILVSSPGMKNGVTRSGSGGLCIGGAKQVSPFFCLPVGARGGRFYLKVSLESAPEAAGMVALTMAGMCLAC
jgi:hypothetical protein